MFLVQHNEELASSFFRKDSQWHEGQTGASVPPVCESVFVVGAVHEPPLHFGFALYGLEEGEAALFVFDAGHFSAENFIEYHFANHPRGDAGTQAAGHGLSGAAQGGVHMQYGLAILAGGEHAYTGHFVGAIDGQQHRFGRHFIRKPGADHDLALPDAAYQDGMSYGYAFLLGEFLDTSGEYVAIFKPYHEDPS